MKICICGKGGSGKSTVVAIVTSEFRRRDKDVLVVDSDESNDGLYWMVGFDKPPAPLMDLAGAKKTSSGHYGLGSRHGAKPACASVTLARRTKNERIRSSTRQRT